MSSKGAIAAFVLPALILFIGIYFVPIVWSSIYSVMNGMEIGKSEFAGFAHYIKMLHSRDFHNSFWVSLRYVIFVSGGQMLFGLLVAFLIFFAIKKYGSVVRTIVFYPIILPVLAVAIMFMRMLDIVPQYGALNALLRALRLGSWVRPWLGQENTAFIWLVIMDVWRAVGYYAIIFYSGLVDIPKDLIEAARIDGCQSFPLVTKIIVPLLRPILLACLTLSLTGTLKVFDSPFTLTSGGPGTATQTLGVYMYKAAFLHGEYNYGSTLAMFMLFECMVVTYILNKINRKSVD